MALSIHDWERTFEDHRTKEIKRLTWIPIPIKQGTGYCRLMRHPRGLEFYGAFVALIQVAASCPKRGTLCRADGSEYSVDDLADLTRINTKTLQEAIDFLEQEIGWLENKIPRDSRGIPRHVATLRGISPTTRHNRTVQDKTV